MKLRKRTKIGHTLSQLMLASLWLASCTVDPPAQAPATTAITPTAAPIPSGVALRPQPTLPSHAPPTLTPQTFTGTIPIPSTATISTSTAPGWTRYDSINQIQDLAFAPDGTLWASTNTGLVHWDLRSAAYTRYLIPTFVIDFAVAPDGTLWLGTQQGVCHLAGLAGQPDGAHCRFYTEADGLIHNAVRAVDVAPDGTVWVGTETGVSRYTDAGSGTGEGGSWHSYPAPVPTQDLAVAPNGEVWHATTAGVGRYQPSEDAWVTYTEAQGLPAGNANVAAIGPDGEVWAYILWQGVYRFTGERWEPAGEIPGSLVGDMAFAADGTPWVLTTSQHYSGGALLFREAATWTDVTAAHGLMAIRALAVEPGGKVAVGTNLGLGIYQGGEWRLLRDGPLSDRVTAVAVTPDGTAWFGFGDYSGSNLGGGLSRFDGQAWDYFLDDAQVNVLAVAPDGALWAGVGCDVRRFDGAAWETVGSCEKDLPSGIVVDMGFTTDGAVWVARAFNLARFDGEWTVFEKLANSLVVAPDGAIWIDGWEGLQDSFYVARYDGASWNTYRTADAFPGSFGVSAVTADGCVWGFAQDRGLACFSYSEGSWADSEAWTFYPLPDALSAEDGRALALAPDGALWLLAANGVARLDASTPVGERASGLEWQVYATQERLAGSRKAIAFGPDGEIWFGARRFQPEQAQALQPTAMPE